jgi:tetratricopeptide (TPR) repeat protein
MFPKLWLIVSLVALVQTRALGCLWDYDTLRDEKRGMPGIAEVLAGQWERHSSFFYKNRVEKMKALLATKPDDQDAMDNLAVAYHKLGQTDAAIAVMLDKEKRFPGQYTTYSNIGTFYMLKGDPDDGITYIKKALAINPNAHFGREEYQLDLAEFLKKRSHNPDLLNHSFIYSLVEPPRNEDGSTSTIKFSDEQLDSDFNLDLQTGRSTKLKYLGLKPNIFQGVVGMLRFGTDQSPDLYFALGDLLALHGDKNLAVRAYQRSLDFNYPRPEAIKNAIDQVESMQVPRGGLNPAVIAAERADAAIWVADYQRFEDDLVRSGQNVDDESMYAPFYATHGRTLKTKDFFIDDYLNDKTARDYPAATILVITSFAISVVLLGRVLLRRLSRPVAKSGDESHTSGGA